MTYTPEQLKALADRLISRRDELTANIMTGPDHPNLQSELDRLNAARTMGEAAAILRAQADALASPPPAEPAEASDSMVDAMVRELFDEHELSRSWEEKLRKCFAAAVQAHAKESAAPQQQPEAAPTDAELEARTRRADAEAQCRALDGPVDLSGSAGQQTAGTGWPPGMLQDDSRELSKALASKPDAMRHAREAAEAIKDAPAEPAHVKVTMQFDHETRVSYVPAESLAPSGAAAEPGELPPLPEAASHTWKMNQNGSRTPSARYSAAQMFAYARSALATSPLPPELVDRVMDAIGAFCEFEIELDDIRAILEGRA